MPEASLWLEVRNESTAERNWTVIEFHSTQSIDSIVYGDYEYYTEDGREPTWSDHDYKLFTGLEITNLPESLVLQGNLNLDDSNDNAFNNTDPTAVDDSAVGGLILLASDSTVKLCSISLLVMSLSEMSPNSSSLTLKR